MKQTLKHNQKRRSKKSTKPNPLTARQLQSRQAQLTLVDVRSKLEYLAGHIPGALNQKAGRILQTVPKDQPIVVTCMSGHRSSSVAQWLVKQGYQKVYNLQGGLISWQMERFPIKRGFRP